MFSSPDITRLICLYSIKSKVARWLKKHKNFVELISGSVILANTAGIHWLLNDYKYVRKVYLRKYDELSGLLKYIFMNKSPRVMELYNRIYESNYELFELIDPSKTKTKIAMGGNIITYTQTLQEPELLDNTSYRYNLLSLNIQIPELMEFYKTKVLGLEDNKNEINQMATNPYTWQLVSQFISFDQVEVNEKPAGCFGIDTFIHFNVYPCSHPVIWYACSNPDINMINLLADNIDFIMNNPYLHTRIFSNPSRVLPIIKILLESGTVSKHKLYFDKTKRAFCSNTNPSIINLLKLYPEFIHSTLSANPLDEAVDILLENPQLINWTYLSANTNPRVYPLLKNNVEKLDIYKLGSNPLIFCPINFTPKLIERIRTNLTTLLTKN